MSSPVIRGRIQEGAGNRADVGQFQIMISFQERSSLLLSPSFILPRMTGEEMNKDRCRMPNSHRDPIVRTVPHPSDMNGNGDIFGGWVLSQMDTAGGALAARVAKGRVATVAITAMTFVEPIKVGDWVSIYGEVSKVGRTSITIALETVVQRRHESTERRVTHGTFVFVAIDDEGKPRPVPQAQSPVATA
jgi:acyl-CoA thioesterase YciA